MNVRMWAIVPLLLLSGLPLAHGQVLDTFGLQAGTIKGTITDDAQLVVPYAGNATIPVTVSAGCGLIAKNAPVLDVAIAFESPPAWLVAEPLTISFAPADCANANASTPVSKTQELSFKVTAAAPGVEIQKFNITGTGKGVSAKQETSFAVQYHADHTVVADVQFPLMVKNGIANFTVTVTQKSNARSMVMFEEMHASTGTISGPGSIAYSPPETKVFKVSYKAPTAAWTNATVNFKEFSHYLILKTGAAGSPRQQHEVSWTFQNGGGVSPTGATMTTKKSPAAGPIFGVGLLAIALVASRRVR